MYERAATTPATTPDGGAGLGPIWHVEGARTFFAGPLRYNAPHRHGAPVFLAGLYGRFGLRIGDGDWTSCRTAMIPAGVSHELFLDGDPLGVLYVEPDLAGPEGLVPLMSGTHHEGTALVGSGGETAVLRDLYEDRAGARGAGDALAGLLGYATVRSRRQVDARIARAISALRTSDEEAPSAAAAAQAVGLSTSRFQHLFSAEVGVPFRRYRAWLRMRLAVRCVLEGGSLTMAAHEAGFYDQAHFAHDFRRTFGAPASGSLVGIRR